MFGTRDALRIYETTEFTWLLKYSQLVRCFEHYRESLVPALSLVVFHMTKSQTLTVALLS